MRVLYLAAYFYPETIAFSHLENDLLKAWTEYGYEIDVVCPTPSRGVSDEVIDKYRSILEENMYEGKVHVHRFRLGKERKGILTRTARYLHSIVSTYTRAKRLTGKIEIVYAGSTPPIQGIMAAKVAKKLKVPFVYNLQDIFPDSLVNAGMTKKGSLIWQVGRRIENYTYKHADRIITISDGFKDNIKQKSVPEAKIIVISNWIDTDEVRPIPRSENNLIARYSLDPSKFYITYCGNVGLSQNFEMLIEAAEQLKDNKDICFIIIGDGVYKETLESAIREKKLDNIILLPFQPYEDIAHVFSLGDVGLIISKPGVGGSSVPSKALSIMAAGRPILASFDEDSELVRMIKENKCGVWSRPDDLVEFVAQSICFTREQNTCQKMGSNGRLAVKNRFSSETQTMKYVSAVSSVVKGHT